MKRALILAVVGCLLGVLATGLTAPSFIGWYYTPGGTASMNCAPDIRSAMSTLMLAQLIAGAVFAVATIIVGTLVARAMARRRAAKQPAAAPPPPVSPPAA